MKYCKSCKFSEELEPTHNVDGFIVDSGLGECLIKNKLVIMSDEACDFHENLKKEKKTNDRKSIGTNWQYCNDSGKI